MECKVIEGSGSSLIFEKDSIRAHIHATTGQGGLAPPCARRP